jgi:zinc D-Ala-D-Ala dipeptidase
MLAWIFPLALASAQTVAVRPAEFVRLSDADPSVRHEIRYFGSDNFVGSPIDGYTKPSCWLTQPAAHALSAVQKALVKEGLSLKVFDCYRPQRAVDHFVRWAKDLSDLKQKARYFPKVEKSRLFADGYIASRSGHSRGSTLDLTLVDKKGRELDMGTPYDFFDPASHTLHPSVTGRARANRLRLVEAMKAAGFRNYEKEWWHYTLEPELFPETQFDFPID